MNAAACEDFDFSPERCCGRCFTCLRAEAAERGVTLVAAHEVAVVEEGGLTVMPRATFQVNERLRAFADAVRALEWKDVAK